VVLNKKELPADESGELYLSFLEIIFVHYVARFFCEPIKLPKEMPKIAKCLKCLNFRPRHLV
jgi:hypothetical protein